MTGGNVSLYNSTGEPGRLNSAIHPTPVVGVLGVFDDVATCVPSGWHEEGLEIYLLGDTREELSGSAWADAIHSHLGGTPPRVSLEKEQALASVLIGAAEKTLAQASHDLSEGGLFQALVDSATRFGVGAKIDLSSLTERDTIDTFTALVSESHARAIVAVRPEDAPALEELARSASVPAARIGTSGGTDLELAGVGTFPVTELRERRARTLPQHLA